MCPPLSTCLLSSAGTWCLGVGQSLLHEYWFLRHVTQTTEKSNLIPLNLVVGARLLDKQIHLPELQMGMAHNYRESKRIG